MSQEFNHNVPSKTNVYQCHIQLNNNSRKMIGKLEGEHTKVDTEKG